MNLPILNLKHKIDIFITTIRAISTSPVVNGKRNFRKFQIPNKRGFLGFKARQVKLGLVDHRGVRMPGFVHPITNRFVTVPELIPELIVPDLSGFKLKPYVSYQVKDVTQSEFTAEDLFNAVYAKKIMEDFKAGALDENGDPINPSEMEKLTPHEAKIRARMTGSDLFRGDDPDFKNHFNN